MLKCKRIYKSVDFLNKYGFFFMNFKLWIKRIIFIIIILVYSNEWNEYVKYFFFWRMGRNNRELSLFFFSDEGILSFSISFFCLVLGFVIIVWFWCRRWYWFVFGELFFYYGIENEIWVWYFIGIGVREREMDGYE